MNRIFMFKKVIPSTHWYHFLSSFTGFHFAVRFLFVRCEDFLAPFVSVHE